MTGQGAPVDVGFGVPPELREATGRLLSDEPRWEQEEVEFAHSAEDPRPFTLRRFLWPHRWGILFSLVLVGVETVAAQAGPRLTAIGIDGGIMAGNLVVVVVVGGVYLGTVVLNALATHARIAWTGRIGERLMFELRARIFTHLQRLSLHSFSKERTGRLMTRMTSDIEALTALFQEGLVNLVIQVLTVVVVGGLLFTMNPELAAFTVGVVVPLMLVSTLWFRRVSDRRYRAVREKIAEVLTDFQESLSGARVVKAHNRQDHNVLQHRNIAGEHRDANVDAGKAGAIYGSGAEFIGALGQALILLVGGWMVLDGSLSIGELTAFVLYLTAFFAPILQLVQLYNTYQSGRAAVIKLRELLATEPSVAESPDAYDLPAVRGEIRFDHVTFGYDPERPVLEDVDMVIAPGETVALVGPTGAGKSTIAKLVARFYDPTFGRVLVDGHDVKDITFASLHHQLGNVPQEPFLFGTSIRENIGFGRPDATDGEILAACRAVGIEELIQRLPQGLDTLCRERGAALSSGERQLLALARAFLAEPRILILDEATSSLDLRSEAKIEQALARLLTGRTAVIIAHRLSTAMRADRIAVVEGGRIVEMGTHAELIRREGRYAEMFTTWMRHAEPGGAPAGRDRGRGPSTSVSDAHSGETPPEE